jgi:hypothetical protein
MDASLRSVQRLLGQWAPHLRGTDRGGPTLETLPAAIESPRLAAAIVIEGAEFEARTVPGPPTEMFGGFLDGAQTSRVLMYDRGVPIVHGVAAAVIRARRERRLVTWRRGVRKHEAVYAPTALAPALCQRLADDGVEVIDTSARLAEADQGVSAEGAHPAVLIDRARRCVEARRERLERALAEEWCDSEDAPLYIDGAIAGKDHVATSGKSVGVLQRHHVLYGGGEAVPRLAALRQGERTTVFLVSSGRSTPVWSWYLRLRDAAGHEPMWGLVRIECSAGGSDTASDRANEISRWVLAERVPIALPDPQWHALAYGIRDCKEMLRATM